MDLELLTKRAGIIREIRAFFDSRQYLAVDTPLLAPDLIPENCLEVFETAWLPPKNSKQQPEKRWLIPSPEIWMKQLIAGHWINMYQVCKCFRNTESRGHLHNPEFTMLEYYTINAGYLDSLSLTEELFCHLKNTADGEKNQLLEVPFMRITVEEAFHRWAGFSLAETAAKGRAAMEKEARRLGLNPKLDNVQDSAALLILYDLIFIHTVEPSIPKDKPVALMDYPAFVPCLAKNGKNSSVKERWELYVNGIELANCYSEETDPLEMRRFFEEETAEKEQNALVKHHIDPNCREKFPKNSKNLFYSGVALGIDRLIMVFSGKSCIESVLPFPF